jgi:hypothetical protein
MARSFAIGAANAANVAAVVAIATFVGACVWLLAQQLVRGVVSAVGGIADRLAAWRHASEAVPDPEPRAQPSADLGPYRTPAFLIEPESDPTTAEDRATSLGLCSAAALLAGVFTLSIDGPRAIAAVAFLLGALLAGLARRPPDLG